MIAMNFDKKTGYEETMPKETEIDNYEDEDTDEEIVGGYLSFFLDIFLHKILIYIVSIVIVYLLQDPVREFLVKLFPILKQFHH